MSIRRHRRAARSRHRSSRIRARGRGGSSRAVAGGLVLRDAACLFQPPIRRGTLRSASCGTTRARGSTTRATARCTAPGSSRTTPGIRSSSRRSSRCSSTCRLRRSASACARRGSCRSSRASPRCCSSRSASAAMAGAPAGLVAGALLATNYVYVMYNRAALMEATMIAFMVAAWYCYVRAQQRPRWGGARAASARCSRSSPRPRRRSSSPPSRSTRCSRCRSTPRQVDAGRRTRPATTARAGLATLAGLAAAGSAALAPVRAAELGELPVLQLADDR